MTHTQDWQCKVDPADDTCRDCGVLHGDPCGDCGGRGFHKLLCGYRYVELRNLPAPPEGSVNLRVKAATKLERKDHLVVSRKTYSFDEDDQWVEHDHSAEVDALQVGETVVHWVAAPGSGKVIYRVTRIDQEGAHGVLLQAPPPLED